MCQFPTEKPWLRPPNFLTRNGAGHAGWPRPATGNLPVTMEDLDVYFESLRNVSCSRSDNEAALSLPPLPPPYILASEPPPPYPDSPHLNNVQGQAEAQGEAENNNEDNNNGDINGNSDLRDQHSERILRPISPLIPTAAARRTMRNGSSLMALHQHHGGHQHAVAGPSRIRESRSYAALISPNHHRFMLQRRADSSSSDSD